MLLQKSSCFQNCCFYDPDISQGSVATHLRCGGIFSNSIIRPPVRSNGRSYKMLVMFIFFRPPFSEFPRPIALKLCHLIGICVYLIMQVQKWGGGALPQKNSGAKNMQNFRWFWTTSDFDCEYLRNVWRYPKSADVTNYGNSSCIWWKKSGELWSSNSLNYMWSTTMHPLKCTFMGDYISAHMGCCALIFLHALEIDQALLAHTPTRTGLPQNFLIVKI